MGFAFALVTPCIGPILAGCWLSRHQRTNWPGRLPSGRIFRRVGIPFLLTALGISRFLRFYQRFRQYLHAVEVSQRRAVALGRRAGFRQPADLAFG